MKSVKENVESQGKQSCGGTKKKNGTTNMVRKDTNLSDRAIWRVAQPFKCRSDKEKSSRSHELFLQGPVGSDRRPRQGHTKIGEAGKKPVKKNQSLGGNGA